MPWIHRRGVTGAGLLFAIALSAVTARAAPGDGALQAARDLFAQAEKDEDMGHWQAALDKFERVAAVRLTAGVQYHVALCQDHIGHLASALLGYEAAESKATEEKTQDVLRLVGVALGPLMARVPRLSIRVTPPNMAKTVTLDGTLLAPGQLDMSLAVDPGSHRVEVTAKGHTAYSYALTVREGEVTFLDISLQKTPPAAAPSSPLPTATNDSSVAPPVGPPSPQVNSEAPRGRTAPIWATALAVALGGVGIGAYFEADAAHNQAVRNCSVVTNRAANPCAAMKDPIRAWDWTAGAAFAGAAAAAVVAIVLWARPAGAPRVASVNQVVVGLGTLGATGSF